MKADVLVIGAGVAGLAASLAAAGRSVVLVSETELGSNVASAWAQGGLAAALGSEDSPDIHASDTVSAGAGIANEGAAQILADEAPEAIASLIAIGVPFARDAAGQLDLGLEAAHSRRRIAHVADATGAAIVSSLTAALRTRQNVCVLERVQARSLLQDGDGTVCGALLVPERGETFSVAAGAVVLATGGYGGLYARTTTPLGALGAGVAMAGRAGAVLADLEFVQFHPTALRVACDPLPLISEAVRGEGAVLVDRTGARIMQGLDPRGELAPRDIVAVAVAEAERSGRDVFLDAREAIGPRFAERFPGVFATARRNGVDPRNEPIPVTPAAHYTIGGVATDLNGRTSLAGLWACGEVASTGLHGANRLASNSLIEGLVFGARAGRDAGEASRPHATRVRAVRPGRVQRHDADAAALHALRATMTTRLGVLRDAAGINAALDRIAALAENGASGLVADAAYVASGIARAALARCESRGAHRRADFAFSDPRFARRSLIGGAPVSAASPS